MNPSDALLFAAVAAGQTADGIKGSLAEIGVFFGRSFFLLAKMASDSEKALTLDLFNIGPTQSGITYQRREFERMAQRLGVDLILNPVIQGDSADVTADEILSLVGNVRFFHIDGGHYRCHVANDSALALASLSDDGVICFDDFCNPEWPEVTAQVVEFLNQQSSFQPFVGTAQKLYLCRAPYVDKYKRMIQDSGLLSKLRVMKTKLDRAEYKVVEDNAFRKIRYRLLVRTPIAAINDLFY